MRILMVNKFLYRNGGSETYMMELGRHLEEVGHEVQYFGMEHEGNCVFNGAGSYTSEMDFHTASAINKIKMSFKTVYSKEARQKLSAVLDDFKPDAVHLNNFNFQLTPSIILEIREWEKKNGSNVKIIYTAHDYQLICPNHMLNIPATGENCEACIGGHFISCTKNKCIHSSTLKSFFGTVEAEFWNRKNIYNELDAMVCCSEFMKTKLDTNPVFAEKTVAIHNFVGELSIPEGCEKKPYVLYLGRLSAEKGVKTLLDAAKALPDISFIFAGTGPLENEVTGDNVEYVGFKTGEELRRLIAEACFSVYPSEWYENCPYSVMESITLGTPVIGANIGGIPELIKDGETGQLFDAGNVDSLCGAIKALWESPDTLEKMYNCCRENRYITLDEYTEKITKIYGN